MVLESIGQNLAFAQILGQRQQQEDEFSWFTDNAYLLLILADGMGGHAKGEVASSIVTEVFMRHFPDSTLPYSNRLTYCLDLANKQIAKKIEDSTNNYIGMGTTLLACVIADEKLHWVSVGDSPLYRYRKGKIEQVNEDHSMAQMIDQMAADGVISTESARSNPMRNRLRSAVTGRELELVDLSCCDTERQDIYLIASDGINSLSDNEIKKIIKANQHEGATHIAKSLIESVEAKETENQDNTTLIVCMTH